jgi:hypothetical protein
MAYRTSADPFEEAWYPLPGQEPMSAYERYGDSDGPEDYHGYEDCDDEEPRRCEMDRQDGGVCLTRLTKSQWDSGKCPNYSRHATWIDDTKH